MRRVITIPAAAMVLASCSDGPMAPERATSLVAPIQASLSIGETTSASAALDFSTDFARITADVIPNFKDADAGVQLKGYLPEINAALAAGDKAEAARVLALADAVVTPEAVNDGDRGYIDMIFRDLRTALQQ